MSADETIRFAFDLNNIEIEISGEREFVDTLYRELMRDIQAARQDVADTTAPPQKGPDPQEVAESLPVWIHRCSNMIRKIYMANAAQMQTTILAGLLDHRVVRTLYVEHGSFDAIMPNLDGNHTIWAELTEQGRRTIHQLPFDTHLKGHKP